MGSELWLLRRASQTSVTFQKIPFYFYLRVQVCVCVMGCHTCEGARGGQMRTLDPRKLEL